MEDVSYQHISERVRVGRIAEARIIGELQELGWEVKVATTKEDRFSKIDCYIRPKGSDKDSDWAPAQIKVRATGDDIIVDVIEPYVGPNHPDNEEGRDMRGSYTRYILGGRNNERPKVYLRSEVSNLIDRTLERWTNNDYKTDPNYDGSSNWYVDSATKVKICIKNDNRSGVQKLLCYIKSASLKAQVPVVQSPESMTQSV